MARVVISDVWQYYVRNENGSPTCKFCKNKIKAAGGSTSNLIRHIKLVHHTKLMPRATISTDSTTATDSVLTENRNNSSTSNNSNTEAITRFFPSNKPISANVKETLDKALVLMLCKESLPINLVDSKYFKSYSNILNHKYSPPTRKSISHSLIPLMYKETRDKIVEKLKLTSSIALTTDGWSNSNNTPFVAVTAHFIDEECKLMSVLLDCSDLEGNHTGANLADCIESTLKTFEIDDKIISITTDNARNMKLAASILGLKHFPCFAHTLNLIVKHAIKESIIDIVEEVKKIVIHFKKSCLATQKLCEVQKSLNMEELKLKQDVPTRWNSTYVMLERFLKNRIALGVCIDTLKINSSLKNEDWETMSQAITILKYFDEATQHASAEKVATLSKMGLLIRVLKKNIGDYKEKTQNIKEEVNLLINSLIEGLSSRFESIEEDIYVTQSMILDPRLKKNSLANEPERFKEAYEAIVNEITPLFENTSLPEATKEKDVPVDSIFYDFLSNMNYTDENLSPQLAARKEIDSYLKLNNIRFSEDPIEWWKTEGKQFSKLYHLFLRRFCIPATSVPSERIFSKVGNIYTDKRNRLAPKRMQEIIFIQQNYEA